MKLFAALFLTLAGSSAAASFQGNVLILVADDLGVDQLAAYGIAPDPPSTPAIDSLAASGVLFRNAWANSLCSPTRATVQTGRYGFRTGIGSVIGPGAAALRDWEVTLPEMLDAGTGGAYAHAAFGKWHLGPFVPSNATAGPLEAPGDAGYGFFAGTMQNLTSYYSFVEVRNGTARPSFGYATSHTVDDVLEWTETAPEPWLAHVGFHAAHVPLNVPPAHLHGVDFSQAGIPGLDTVPYYRATVEALDTEIGRLLEGLGDVLDETTVLFLGDNGTTKEGVAPPFDPEKNKGTLYQGGVHVPLIVTGPAVNAPGLECSALVNTTDVFATVAELAGVDLASVVSVDRPLDSVSLVPYLHDPAAPSLRATVYAEQFHPNGFGPYESHDRAIRGPRYKLIVKELFTPQPARTEELYDLELDPFELADLLAAPGPLAPPAAQAYRQLARELEALLEPPVHTPPLVQEQ